MRVLLLLLMTLSIAACATRRPYVPTQVAPAALGSLDATLVVEQPLDLQWWDQFDDPVLDALVDAVARGQP